MHHAGRSKTGLVIVFHAECYDWRVENKNYERTQPKT